MAPQGAPASPACFPAGSLQGGALVPGLLHRASILLSTQLRSQQMQILNFKIRVDVQTPFHEKMDRLRH